MFKQSQVTRVYLRISIIYVFLIVMMIFVTTLRLLDVINLLDYIAVSGFLLSLELVPYTINSNGRDMKVSQQSNKISGLSNEIFICSAALEVDVLDIGRNPNDNGQVKLIKEIPQLKHGKLMHMDFPFE